MSETQNIFNEQLLFPFRFSKCGDNSISIRIASVFVRRQIVIAIFFSFSNPIDGTKPGVTRGISVCDPLFFDISSIHKILYIVTLTRYFYIHSYFSKSFSIEPISNSGLDSHRALRSGLFCDKNSLHFFHHFSLYILTIVSTSRKYRTIFKERHVFINDACLICPLTRRYLSFAM